MARTKGAKNKSNRSQSQEGGESPDSGSTDMNSEE